MESLMSLKDTFVAAYPIGESPWPLLHIVAVYGTAEMIDCMKRWTRIDWDRQHTIHEDIFKGASRYPKVKEATALYLATCLERTETVRSLVKLAGEDNIRSCLQGLKFSNEIEHIFMLELADRLRQKHAELKPIIVPGHRREDNGTKSRVFIVYSMSVVQSKDYDSNGLGLVKLRNPYVIQRSNNFASGSEMGLLNKSTETLSNDDVESSQKDAKRVREAIKTHGDHLWQKHSNLNIITGKQVNINGSQIGEACVVLYCSTKGVIPLGENEFPRTLCIQNDVQIKVAVREGFFEFGVYKSIPSTWPHPTLKMGCEIGRLKPQIGASGHLPSGGTLGPFVRYNNNLGFLTCSHVLFDIPTPSHTIDYTAVAPPLIEVVQPSSDATLFVSGTPCGVVERAMFDPTGPIGIDAAIVKLTDQSTVPSAGQFSNERHSSYQKTGFRELPEYNSGAMISAQVNDLLCKPNVVKFGSRTDVTRGALSVFGADVRAFSTALGLPNNAGGVLMKNQYLVIGIYPSTDFFDGGDSGSGVFYQDSSNGQLQCVGMAIGHGVLSDYPYKVGVVTPIDAILQALGSNISLATFP
ncbi:uncharacterized protein [Argopecten irradians]|uniref:uncharacterized protein n=1 Tax=Argopecten irradians TaxID=31199 RepID=UPI0037172308